MCREYSRTRTCPNSASYGQLLRKHSHVRAMAIWLCAHGAVKGRTDVWNQGRGLLVCMDDRVAPSSPSAFRRHVPFVFPSRGSWAFEPKGSRRQAHSLGCSTNTISAHVASFFAVCNACQCCSRFVANTRIRTRAHVITPAQSEQQAPRTNIWNPELLAGVQRIFAEPFETRKDIRNEKTRTAWVHVGGLSNAANRLGSGKQSKHGVQLLFVVVEGGGAAEAFLDALVCHFGALIN